LAFDSPLKNGIAVCQFNDFQLETRRPDEVPMKKSIIHLVAGARPNFMKVAPLWHALSAEAWCEPRIVHTGQHYDDRMSSQFFRDFDLPQAHYNLGVGSGTHARQTADVMVAYESICQSEPPDWVIVVGDVNSTVAAALVAKKLNLPVAHLEAGLRSGDRAMPEEINRLATDAIADLLWTPSADADENLLREGHDPQAVERVGNIMIDAFEMLRPVIESTATDHLSRHRPAHYAVATIHRPSNVDSASSLSAVVEALLHVNRDWPLVFPIHPRTVAALERFGLRQSLVDAGVTLLEPLGYTEFMALIRNARMVVTDSGGVQEETSYLGIPCFTLRENTERPVTVTQGTNKLVSPAGLVEAVRTVPDLCRRSIDLWDGKTALRVVESLRRHVVGSS
jgi:UDP-N-acetylglucosamine 2-epimerase (non-hydrolysing)